MFINVFGLKDFFKNDIELYFEEAGVYQRTNTFSMRSKIYRDNIIQSTTFKWDIVTFYLYNLSPSTSYKFDVDINGMRLSTLLKYRKKQTQSIMMAFKTLPSTQRLMSEDESVLVMMAGNIDLRDDFRSLFYLSRLSAIIFSYTFC